jgi:hypothetical protein
MPPSETSHIDYIPSGWSEELYESTYVEWVFNDDETILVRLDGTRAEGFTVTPITGINAEGEEFVTRPISGLSEEDAFHAAASLVYAINGAIGRTSGDPEFSHH